MNTLNLISPERSTISYKTMAFPDGQPHIKIDIKSLEPLDKKERLVIRCRLSNSNDLLMVLFIKNTLDYLEFEQVELDISYLTAARMDRIMLDGEPFSLKVIAGIINQGNFKKVRIFDPHSDTSTALIDRSYTITNHHFVQDAINDYLRKNVTSSYCLVSPDAGALKKIHKLAQFLQIENLVECMKERDVKTGALVDFKTTQEDLQNQTCFIVDDICDGGGTFVGTAKMLKEKGAGKIILIVSHGIFSKGTSIAYVDDIYATDSFKQTDGIHCFSIENYW